MHLFLVGLPCLPHWRLLCYTPSPPSTLFLLLLWCLPSLWFSSFYPFLLLLFHTFSSSSYSIPGVRLHREDKIWLIKSPFFSWRSWSRAKAYRNDQFVVSCQWTYMPALCYTVSHTEVLKYYMVEAFSFQRGKSSFESSGFGAWTKQTVIKCSAPKN